MAPAVSLSPLSLSFGNQQVGTSSVPQTVTLINSGTTDLTISSIALSGPNSGDFALNTTCPSSPIPLAAGDSCIISVTFTPTATGSRSAIMTITDNASSSPQLVVLSGSGTTASAPAVSLSPTIVNFGNQNVGTTSTAQTVMLTNTGTAVLSINSIAITGPNASEFALVANNCSISPGTLAAGASCAISVTFTPTTTGSRSARVTITDNASSSPQSVALSGTGVLGLPGVNVDIQLSISLQLRC